MKRIIQKIVMIMALLPSFLSVQAYDFEVEGFYYDANLKDMTATLVSGENKYKGDINVPSSVTYKGREFIVSTIDGAFERCDEITSVFIPNTVTLLGDESFDACSNLIEISGCEGVEKIGNRCFRFCMKLTSIPLSTKILSVGDYAFYNCESITNVPNSAFISQFGDAVFKNCTGLENIELSESLTSITPEMFSGCISLSNIKLPENIMSIGSCAFTGCSELTQIEIPSQVSVIEQNAFAHCTNMTDFIISDGDSKLDIASSALFGTYMHKVYIGRDLTYKQDTSNYGITLYSPFDGKFTITQVIIGSHVTYLYDHLFRGCSNLRDLSIPANLTYIEYGVFLGCSNLRKLSFEDSTKPISFGGTNTNPVVGGNLFFNDCPLEYVYIGRKILSGHKYPRYGFSPLYNQTQLKTIVIGDFVDDINCLLYQEDGSLGQTLSRYSDLQSLSLGASIKFVPDLSDNLNLADFNISATLPPSAVGFNNAQFMNLTPNIPTGSLGSYEQANIWSNFWEFKELDKLFKLFEVDSIRYYVKNTNEVDVVPGSTSYTGRLTIPSNVVSNDKSWTITGLRDAFYGSEITSIKLPCTIQTIPAECFLNCANLTSIEVQGDFLKTISNSSFENCTSLQEVILPSSINSIGSNAFKGCYALKSFITPSNVATIGDSAFENCNSMQTFEFNSNIQSIGCAIFKKCNQLQDIKLPSKITAIPSEAFASCSAIESIDLPNILYIGSKSFENCSSLREITFGNNLESIDDKAFIGCESLVGLTIPASVENVGYKIGGSYLKELIIEDGNTPLIFPPGDKDTNNIFQQWHRKEVNGKIIEYRIWYYNSYFQNSSIEKLYIGRNLSDKSRYENSGDIDGNYDSMIITSYDAPFSSLPDLKELEIGENVSVLGPNKEYISQIDMYSTPGSFKNCTNIKLVIVKNGVPPTGAEFSTSTYNNADLIVPVNTIPLYEVAEGWKDFINIYDGQITDIVLNETDTTLYEGQTIQLTAAISPKYVNNKTLEWTSTNVSVATVDQSGLVTAVAQGNAVITASSTDGSAVSVSCNVQVQNQELGIENVVSQDENSTYLVYNLQGITILKTHNLNELQQLPTGMYIVNGKKFIVE